MKKAARYLVAVGVLAASLSGRPALAVENAIQTVRALPSQLSAYTINGQVVAGTGIRIADIDSQIELDHPALAGKIISHSDYSTEGMLDPDTDFFAFLSPNGQRVWVNDMHATAVAGVLVSNGLDSTGTQTDHIGISPGATLDIAKYWESDLEKDADLALQAAFDLTAGPASILLVEDQSNDKFARGDSSYSAGLDYLALARDVLVVIPAGNSGPDNVAFSVPADAYNGLSVGATDGQTGQVASFSSKGPTDDTTGGRGKPDLVAPGVGMVLPFGGFEDDDGRDASSAINYKGGFTPADVTQFRAPNITPEEDVDADWITVSGTSFSGPLVAGTGALLQQWGGHHGMDTSSQTLRAVIVNSVNKVDGVLGMSQTITDRDSLDWFSSEAYTDQAIPLDDQMGAGQLDVLRAMQQYDAGEQGPGDVQNVGWDKHLVLTESEYIDYTFGESLQAGDFLSATLAWTRDVFFADGGVTGSYDPETDGFAGLPLDNLDLYLMHSDDTATEQALWSSVSTVDNLEHLFWQVPLTGDYKLRVVFTEDVTFLPGLENTPEYALAWWAGVPEPGSGAALALMGIGCLRRTKRRSSL